MRAFVRHLLGTYETLELASMSAASAYVASALAVVFRILENRGRVRGGWCDLFLLWGMYFAAAACGLVLLAFVRANQAASVLVAGGRRA